MELVSFVEGPNSVVCQVRHADGHEESVESSWLIGCDGAHSTVRKCAGMPFTGHAEPNDWMLADIHIGGSLPEDEVGRLYTPRARWFSFRSAAIDSV